MLYDYPEVTKQVMDEFLLYLQAELPELILGCYLYGSIALGNFEFGKSDIDFVVLLAR